MKSIFPPGLEHNKYKVGAVTLTLTRKVSSAEVRGENRIIFLCLCSWSGSVSKHIVFIYFFFSLYSTWQGRGEWRFSLFVFLWAVGGRRKEVTFVGSAVGVRCYEYEGFVSADILWQAGEEPSAVTRAFLFFKKAWRPRWPVELKWRPPSILLHPPAPR